MYDRFLFVGLGGSGGSTIGYLKREIQKWLRENNVKHADNVPVGWQFLHIDTPNISDANPRLADNEYLGLVNVGLTYNAVQSLLDVNPDLHDELQTWRVDPTAMPVPLATGAGQFRALGRTIAMAYANTIRTALGASISKLSEGRVETELRELYFTVTGQPAKTGQSRLFVVVVSSLAGGTGAGLLCTVCDILRSMDTDAEHNVFGVLYTPEVFSMLGDVGTGGVQPNSLAAICEVLNGYWWNGAPGGGDDNARVNPKESAELVMAQLPFELLNGGPRFPFLVGKVNSSGVDHGTPSALFNSVGRSLLSWTTDIQAKEDFLAYTITNWQNDAENHLMAQGLLVDHGLNSEIGFPAFSALGFARLSIGTDYFKEYAACRLVREALQHSATFHVKSDLAIKFSEDLSTNDPDEIAGAIANLYLRLFMKKSNLSEGTKEDGEDNDFLRRLRPDSADQIEQEYRETVKTLSGINNRSKMKTEEWVQQVRNAITNCLPDFQTKYSAAVDKETEDWVEKTPGYVVKALEEVIALYGLKVAAETCGRAAQQLGTIAKEIRLRDTEYNIHWFDRWQELADENLAEVWGKQLESDDMRLLASVNRAVQMTALSGNSLVARRAAALAEETANGVLAPLTTELNAAQERAEADFPVVQEYPAWGDLPLPPDFVPPVTELTLIESTGTEFHDQFEKYLGLTLSEKQSTAARETVRTTLISGEHQRKQYEDAELEHPESLLCIHIDNDWWPNPSATGPVLKPQRDLGVTVNADVEALYERALHWLARPGSIFGEFLNASLRDYLGSTDSYDDPNVTEADYERRREIFIAQLGGVVSKAEPLISIDNNLLGNVHPNSPTLEGVTKKVISKIPLAAHPIQDRVVERLNVSGIPEQVIVDDLLNTDSSLKHVDITTALHAPHSILVAESLLRPIAKKWEYYVAQNNKDMFWSRRRARPIAEFVPAPQALIHCMVRGWFTGVLLGYIDHHGQPVRIARYDDDEAEFPEEFLSRGAGRLDQLPLVLEALALAYVEVSRSGTLRALEAYCALRDLGREEPEERGGRLYRYEYLHPYLDHWVKTGEVERLDNRKKKDVLLAPISVPILDSGDTPLERAEVLVGRLEKQITAYQDLMYKERKKWRKDPHTLSGPPQWTGIWKVINRELGLLRDAANKRKEELQGLEEGPGEIF